MLSALAAQAEVIMVSGTVYDVGKANHSQDPDLKGVTADSNHCWAATSANLIQHWLDAYRDRLDLENVPNGEATEVVYTMPSGTRYLNVYNDISDNFQDEGGYLSMATGWFFNGQNVNYLKTDHAAGGYLTGVNMKAYTVNFNRWGFYDLASLKIQLGNTLTGAAGYGAFLSICTLQNTGYHAITCWGMETDAEDNLCALYVTDSDDMKFGAQRLEVRYEDGVIKLDSQNANSSYYGGGYKLSSFSYMDSFAYYDEKPSNALTALPENGEISTAADMTGRSLSAGHGLTLKQGALLAASGGKGTGLTLAGGGAAGDGLTVQAGAMGVLKNAAVSISGFAGNGVSCGADLYMDGGTVSISGNGGIGIAAQGTGDDPKVYVSLSGNSSVTVSDNAKGGLLVKGGALPSKNVEGSYYRAGATVDINRNTGVEISRNSAVDGAGAFVTGTLNVKDNTGNVAFDHNTATGKGGALAVSSMLGDSVLLKGQANITGNTAITFSNNSAAQGGAIYATKLVLDNNDKVAFTGNTATQGAAVYGGSEAVAAGNGGYYVVNSNISIQGNKEVSITGNTATDTDIIFFRGERMSLSGNGAVDISGNTAKSASGAVVHNADPYIRIGTSNNYMSASGLAMEIAHNGSVTFADNTAKYDIYNEGTLYLCADADQTITFQHGFQNSPKTTSGLTRNGGTTYIGKDAAGTPSTGGAYCFEDGSAAVEMKTSGATVEVGGGMVFSPTAGSPSARRNSRTRSSRWAPPASA